MSRKNYSGFFKESAQFSSREELDQEGAEQGLRRGAHFGQRQRGVILRHWWLQIRNYGCDGQLGSLPRRLFHANRCRCRCICSAAIAGWSSGLQRCVRQHQHWCRDSHRGRFHRHFTHRATAAGTVFHGAVAGGAGNRRERRQRSQQDAKYQRHRLDESFQCVHCIVRDWLFADCDLNHINKANPKRDITGLGRSSGLVPASVRPLPCSFPCAWHSPRPDRDRSCPG